MRHGKVHRKFGRKNKRREALMVSLAVALIDRNAITTTEAKAKSLRPFIEKLVTRGRVGGVAQVRILQSTLPQGSVIKLTNEIGPRFKDVAGGYTRITKLLRRTSDGSKMAKIEFIR